MDDPILVPIPPKKINITGTGMSHSAAVVSAPQSLWAKRMDASTLVVLILFRLQKRGDNFNIYQSSTQTQHRTYTSHHALTHTHNTLPSMHGARTQANTKTFLRSGGCPSVLFTVSENSCFWCFFLQFQRILRLWHILLFQRIPPNIMHYCMETHVFFLYMSSANQKPFKGPMVAYLTQMRQTSEPSGSPLVAWIPKRSKSWSHVD